VGDYPDHDLFTFVVRVVEHLDQRKSLEDIQRAGKITHSRVDTGYGASAARGVERHSVCANPPVVFSLFRFTPNIPKRGESERRNQDEKYIRDTIVDKALTFIAELNRLFRGLF